MPFEATDPRATLATAADPEASSATSFARAQYVPFVDADAHRSGLGSRTWFVRIENCAVAYTIAAPGDELERFGDASERIVALPDTGTALEIQTGRETVAFDGAAIAIVPPTPTKLRSNTGGVVLQMFTRAATDVFARALNAAAYTSTPPNVRVHEPDPALEEGLRIHRLGDHPSERGRFGTIFRSTNLMINFINDRVGARDPRALSPHSHADFEQCSIQLGGRIVHHVRTPWTPDKTTWREDEHVEIDGAGIVIFPPPMIHTSQAVGAGINRLIDAFAPPRTDFLEKGWVLNEADYIALPGTR
jgi:hypothetical protein